MIDEREAVAGMGLIGLALLAAGLALWWPPAAFMVPGAILFALAVVKLR